jgi:hypothetical protein
MLYIELQRSALRLLIRRASDSNVGLQSLPLRRPFVVHLNSASKVQGNTSRQATTACISYFHTLCEHNKDEFFLFWGFLQSVTICYSHRHPPLCNVTCGSQQSGQHVQCSYPFRPTKNCYQQQSSISYPDLFCIHGCWCVHLLHGRPRFLLLVKA